MATFNYDPRTAVMGDSYQKSMLELEKFRNAQAQTYFNAALAVDTQNRANALGQDTLDNSVVARRVNNANATQRELLNDPLRINTGLYGKAFADPLVQDQAIQAIQNQQKANWLTGMLQVDQAGLAAVDPQSGQITSPNGTRLSGMSPFGAGLLNGAQTDAYTQYTMDQLKPRGAGGGVVGDSNAVVPINGAPVAGSPLYGPVRGAPTSEQQLAEIVRNSTIAQRYGANGVPVTNIPAVIKDGVGAGAFPAYPETVMQRYGGVSQNKAVQQAALQSNPELLAAQSENIGKKIADVQLDYDKVTAYGANYPADQKAAVISEYNRLLQQQRELIGITQSNILAQHVGAVTDVAGRVVSGVGDYLDAVTAARAQTLGTARSKAQQAGKLSRDYTVGQ